MQNLSFITFLNTQLFCVEDRMTLVQLNLMGFKIDMTKPTKRNTISRLESGLSHGDYNSAMTTWSTPKDTEGPLWSEERGSPHYRISFTLWGYHMLRHSYSYCGKEWGQCFKKNK